MLGGILCFDVAVSIPWRLIRRFEGRRSLENCSGRRSAVRGALLCGETPRPQPAPVSVSVSFSLLLSFSSSQSYGVCTFWRHRSEEPTSGVMCANAAVEPVSRVLGSRGAAWAPRSAKRLAEARRPSCPLRPAPPSLGPPPWRQCLALYVINVIRRARGVMLLMPSLCAERRLV